MTLARSFHTLLQDAPAKAPTILDDPGRPRRRSTAVTISAKARIGGMLILAPSGAGKSILTAKHFALSDVRNGIPQVILDVGGQCIENFLHSLLFLDKEEQQAILSRVVYCDMAGSDDFITSWPLFAPRHKDERLYVTATRLPELLGQLDVNFANATIQGLTRAIPIATMTGKLLAALGLPITYIFDLLRHPERWIGQVSQLEHIHPEVQSAVEDFIDYLSLNKRLREERTEPFLNRLNLLRHDEVSRAMFGSMREPTIDFDRVSRTGQTVLIDFSREYSQFARQFKLLYVFNMLLEHIAHRGRGAPPLSVLIDELSFFVRGAAHTNTGVIAEQFRQMIEQRMRNNNVYLTLATQELRQIPVEMLSACLNLKNLLIGAQSDPETAQYLADRFTEMDSMRVKYWERVWASEQLQDLTQHIVIDHRPVFSPLEEQKYIASRVFMNLRKGTWLFAESAGEGELATSVRPITTQHLYTGPFPSENPQLIQKLRSYLTRKAGIPLSEALAEIEQTVQSVYPAPHEAESPQQPQPIARHVAPPVHQVREAKEPVPDVPQATPSENAVPQEEKEQERLPAHVPSANGSTERREPEPPQGSSGTLITHNTHQRTGRRVGVLPLDDAD